MAFIKYRFICTFIVLCNLLITFFLYFRLSNDIKSSSNKSNEEKFPLIIEIWSKAAIGDYLWLHVLESNIKTQLGDGYYRYGTKNFEYNNQDYNFQFRSGFSLLPNTLSAHLDQLKITSKRLILLVLNGRTKQKVQTARTWLNLVAKKVKSNENLRVGLILLGDEKCFNHWILSYLHINGGFLRFLFIVYDWQQIDNENIFQWPLGVATYRAFPLIKPNSNLVSNKRPNTCNFFGTVYKKSSREELIKTYQKMAKQPNCLMKPRDEWQENETEESLADYIDALKKSDVTLNPLGMNHECYRIYEAMSLGSYVWIEENLNHVQGIKSRCDQQSAFRLLKQYKAPVKYIGNWTIELQKLLSEEIMISEDKKRLRRIQIITWYQSFKQEMMGLLLKVISQKMSD